MMFKQVIATSVCAAFVTFGASAIELTTNGGFEAGDTSGWESFPTGDSTFAVTGDASSGSFAGELFNNASGSAAVIKQANLGIGTVSPGDAITVTFDAKGEGFVGGVSFAEFFSELDGGGTSANEIFGNAPLALTSAYQTFAFNTVAGPDVSGGVTLQFTATTGANIGSTQRLFIDNVSVDVVPEPASLGLLGVGGLALLARRRK